jgi:predicted transport protein
MNQLRVFRVHANGVTALAPGFADLEAHVQRLVENNLETIFGIRLLASEFRTSSSHGGRIDTLGLDENNCPVIIEYKRYASDSVINQGLFYLAWLVEHRDSFALAVHKKFGAEIAESIDWNGVRLICVAADFNKYDQFAVSQMSSRIELVRFGFFGDDVFAIEPVTAPVNAAKSSPGASVFSSAPAVKVADYEPEWEKWWPKMNPHILTLYNELEDFILSLGDDVTKKYLKQYIAFRRLRNFTTIVVPKDKLIVQIHLDPKTVELHPGFMFDTTNKGTWGTGNLQVQVQNEEQLEVAKQLIAQAYRA